ncbi:MAG: threonine aldolase family protein [Actinomycetota bacterium]
MHRVDLRSDTVTRPSPAMRTAMAQAEVGDVEYDDDPTVRLLQERAAEITGTEAAIYLVTGTMCNQIALHVLTRPGHVVACAQDAHVAGVEGPTSALLSGLTFRQVPTEDGVMAPADVESALEPDPDRGPIVDLIAVENTHQVGGGTPWSLDDLQAVAKVARQAELPLYMDGSRIFNASVATGTPVSAYAAEAHALMFCLSKGLGAPIGSMLCGPADFIEEARRTKLLFGISWRQAGITAAAGIVALDESPGRLHRDHENALLLAEGVAMATPGAVDPARVRTNIVFADPSVVGLTADEAAARLADDGVLVNVVGGRVRFVTHCDVSAADIPTAIDAWRSVAGD